MKDQPERPEIVTDEHLKFLDALRESGDVNMAGAGLHVRDMFILSKQESREVAKYWRETFGSPGR